MVSVPNEKSDDIVKIHSFIALLLRALCLRELFLVYSLLTCLLTNWQCKLAAVNLF